MSGARRYRIRPDCRGGQAGSGQDKNRGLQLPPAGQVDSFAGLSGPKRSEKKRDEQQYSDQTSLLAAHYLTYLWCMSRDEGLAPDHVRGDWAGGPVSRQPENAERPGESRGQSFDHDDAMDVEPRKSQPRLARRLALAVASFCFRAAQMDQCFPCRSLRRDRSGAVALSHPGLARIVPTDRPNSPCPNPWTPNTNPCAGKAP
jgi:hypothetical protein